MTVDNTGIHVIEDNSDESWEHWESSVRDFLDTIPIGIEELPPEPIAEPLPLIENIDFWAPTEMSPLR